MADGWRSQDLLSGGQPWLSIPIAAVHYRVVLHSNPAEDKSSASAQTGPTLAAHAQGRQSAVGARHRAV